MSGGNQAISVIPSLLQDGLPYRFASERVARTPPAKAKATNAVGSGTGDGSNIKSDSLEAGLNPKPTISPRSLIPVAWSSFHPLAVDNIFDSSTGSAVGLE